MANDQDDIKRPHGETGDTVQQAAEVSQPTTTHYPGLDKAAQQVPADATTAGTARERTGGGAA